MALAHELIFQLIFILNWTVAMPLYSLGSSTPFAKNFQLVLVSLRVPTLFRRIFKKVTVKSRDLEFVISIILFLLTLKVLLLSLRISHNSFFYGISMIFWCLALHVAVQMLELHLSLFFNSDSFSIFNGSQ